MLPFCLEIDPLSYTPTPPHPHPPLLLDFSTRSVCHSLDESTSTQTGRKQQREGPTLLSSPFHHLTLWVFCDVAETLLSDVLLKPGLAHILFFSCPPRPPLHSVSHWIYFRGPSLQNLEPILP